MSWNAVPLDDINSRWRAGKVAHALERCMQQPYSTSQQAVDMCQIIMMP